jgi:hypothetical protein
MALVVGTFALAWGGDIRQKNLNVLVVDQTGVPNAMLQKASLTAQAIFKKAGIQMEWLTCASSSQKHCDQNDNVAYPNLFIVIPPQTSKSRESRALGVALLATGQRTGDVAHVFYDRIETAACGVNGFRNVPKALCDAPSAVGHLLANVMAHETAHLLGLTHSRGMMSTGWTDWDVKQASNGPLLFSEREAQELRDAVAARLANAATQNAGHASRKYSTTASPPITYAKNPTPRNPCFQHPMCHDDYRRGLHRETGQRRN